MKIIRLHKKKLEDYIEPLKLGKRVAQQEVYGMLSAKMLSVCRQYVKDTHFAEDVLVSGFLKVFTQIEKFENKGSFEGWIRRIMVHEAISYIRTKKPLDFLEDHEFHESVPWSACDMSMEDLELLIDALPDGCRAVFSLYVVEGYKHHEIAKMLQIQEGTSKSQLALARKILQKQLLNLKDKGLWNGMR